MKNTTSNFIIVLLILFTFSACITTDEIFEKENEEIENKILLGRDVNNVNINECSYAFQEDVVVIQYISLNRLLEMSSFWGFRVDESAVETYPWMNVHALNLNNSVELANYIRNFYINQYDISILSTSTHNNLIIDTWEIRYQVCLNNTQNHLCKQEVPNHGIRTIIRNDPAISVTP